MEVLVYDVAILLYALSLLFSFVDVVHRHEGVRRLGLISLTALWGFLTLFFVWKAVAQGHPFAIFEGVLFYAWLLIGSSILLYYWLRTDLVIFLSNVLGFAVMVLVLVLEQRLMPNPLPQELISGLMHVHISLAFLSYVAFTFSFVFSLMYVLGMYLLKGKVWRPWRPLWVRLPSLEQNERYAFWCNLLGFPLLLIAALLGLLWAYLADLHHWADPKIVLTLLALSGYGILSYLYLKKGMRGGRLALVNLLAFILILINLSAPALFSSFHQW